jgi:TRAP transporter TAXI family solute receptor
MKRTILLGSIIASMAIIALVIGSAGIMQTEAAASDDFKWPRMLRVATPGTASGSFASTNGWAPLLQSATGMSVRVIPEDSEPGRYRRLTEDKEFELASISVAEARFQIEGIEGYAAVPPNPMFLVWHHNDTPWAWVVRGDSKYKTIYDLKQKGVRVSLSSQSPAMMLAIQSALPAFLGWTPEEAAQNWTYVPAGSYVENCRSVTDGRADVAWVAPISAVLYEMAGHPRGIRFLSQPLSDTEAWQGWLRYRPTHVPTTIDFGVPEAIGTDGLSSSFNYWTRADMDEETVYRLAKWFHESFDEYKGVHALAPRMSIEHFRKFLDYQPMPVHPGTVRYLREIGQWTEKDDEWNNAALDLMNRWLAARKAANEEASAKRVRMHWENQEYVDIVKKHTADLPIFRTRL